LKKSISIFIRLSLLQRAFARLPLQKTKEKYVFNPIFGEYIQILGTHLKIKYKEENIISGFSN
jgi:hypothetical protein